MENSEKSQETQKNRTIEEYNLITREHLGIFITVEISGQTKKIITKIWEFQYI